MSDGESSIWAIYSITIIPGYIYIQGVHAVDRHMAVHLPVFHFYSIFYRINQKPLGMTYYRLGFYVSSDGDSGLYN